MDVFGQQLISVFLEIWSGIRETEPTTALSLWGVGVLSVGLSAFLVDVIGNVMSKKDVAKARLFKVKLTEDHSTIRLHESVFERFGLKKIGGQVQITGVEDLGNGKFKRVRTETENLSYRRTGMDADEIEISDITLQKVFKNSKLASFEDGVYLILKPYTLKGIAQYWRDPDDRTRFANQFAVYLAIIMFVSELILS